MISPIKQRIRTFFATLVDVFTSRFDLASAELEDLLIRLGGMLALMLACGLAMGFALLFLSFTIVMAVPEGYRWIPALALTAVYALGAAYCGWQLRRALKSMPPPFATTRDVLRRDAAALRPVVDPAPAAPVSPE